MVLNGFILDEVLPLRELYTIYREHRRLKVFVHKGRECVICKKEGVLLLKTIDKSGREHIDLYADDFTLITVDHIVPRSVAKKLGWNKNAIERLTNKQPMCTHCNGRKGNKLITNDECIARLRGACQIRRNGNSILHKLVNNNNIFNRDLEGVI